MERKQVTHLTNRVDDATRVFLEALERTGNISLSCKMAGVSRTYVYERRDKDAAFAAAWENALKIAVDTLEAEAWRRARDGVPEFVTTGKGLVLDDEGKPVTQNRYSDSLLALLLRAHNPERYRERASVDLNVTGNLAELIDAGRKRAQKRDDETEE